MNDDYDKNPHFRFELFSGKWWRIVAIGLVLLIAVAVKACSQERAKTVSVQKEKRFGTRYLVCVETTSGKRYSLKWNAHTYYSKNVEIPREWTVAIFKSRYYIKPLL